MLVVRGEAGIGKTALLQHLVSVASDARVARTTGVESEMALPFAALQQLCVTMLDRLPGLPGPQRDAACIAFGLTSGSTPDRLMIGLAVLTLLSAVSNDGPLLCLVDDAQWLDRESAQALTLVARRLLADRVGLVFATRVENQDFARFPELHVEALRDADARRLLGTVLHIPLDERVRDRIVAETQCNPLALVEWPRGRSPAELAGGFGMPAVSMTGQIEENFRRRLAELPPPTQRFLAVAAAEPTGDPVVVWRAATALGVGPNDAAPAMDAGLVDIGVRVSFRHPLARSAAYGAAGHAERQAAHRELAQATDPELDPDRRAWHRALGSPGPDEDIAHALEQSAWRARRRGGLAAAGALLARSGALTVDPSRRAQRLLAAADAHLEAGSFDVAAELLSSAEAASLDEMGRAQLDMLRARHASVGGDMRDAPELLLRAARRLEQLDAGLAADTYLQTMAAATVGGTFVRGVTLRDIARVAMSWTASTEPTTHALLVAGLAQATIDGPSAATPTLRRVLDASLADTTATEPFYWSGYLTAAASTLWDSEALHRLADVHVRATREIGALTLLPWALNSLAHVLALEGDLDGAASVTAEANQLVEATGGNIHAWGEAVLAGWRGDGDSLRVIDDLAESGRESSDAIGLKYAMWGRAILFNGMAQYDQALAAAVEADRQPWEWGSQNHYHELIEAAARCGQQTIAAAALTRLGEAVEATDSDWGLGLHIRSSALLSAGPAAEHRYKEAIDRLSRSAMRPELARSHLLYGEWLRRENRRVDARGELRTAYEMFLAMGIRAFAERTRHELLATGETVRKRSGGSFDELTPQEAHIARLAADGRTNPEIGAQLFISPRTVEWHLRKVFTKLGVASRRALREALLTPV